MLVPEVPAENQLQAWRSGIRLEDGQRTLPARVSVEGSSPDGTWLKVVLQEGKKRQIRKMGEKTGLPVQRLIRTRIASLTLGDLASGEWRRLTEEEVQQLKQ